MQNKTTCAYIIGILEGQEDKHGIENLFEEIMSENFPDTGKSQSPVVCMQEVAGRCFSLRDVSTFFPFLSSPTKKQRKYIEQMDSRH